MRITISDIEYADQAEDVAAMFVCLADRRRQREPSTSGTVHDFVYHGDRPAEALTTDKVASDTVTAVAVAGQPVKAKGKGGRPKKTHTAAEVKANTAALANAGPAPTDAPIAEALTETAANDPDDLSDILNESGFTEASEDPEEPEPAPAPVPPPAPTPVPAAEPVPEPVAEDTDDIMSMLFAEDPEPEEEAPQVDNRWTNVTGKPLMDAVREVAQSLGGQRFTALLNSYGVRGFRDLSEDISRQMLHDRDIAAALPKAA